uniref:TonB-dependent receptor n=1 Tax=Sphingomonas sp. TaxID=28214 RepID=UPI0025D256DC
MLLATATPLAAAELPTAHVDAAGTGEDIIVTAQKRSQTLIDVPQSVSVVGGAALERAVATTFQDYLKLVPGLQLEQSEPGQTRLILRGLNTGGVVSTVAVYQDETPFGSSTGLANGAILAGDFDTFDVARIEVLRGPQGTLYGANALGGIVKYVTNLPTTAAFSVRARGGVETTQGGDISYYGNAVVNVPLGSNLAFRASGTYRKNGGWIDSIGTGGSRLRDNINSSRVYGGRASLLFTPTPNISLRLSALLQNFDVGVPSLEESDGQSLTTRFGRPTQSVFVSPYRNIRYRVYDATATVGLGFATLTLASSYSTQKQPSRTDETSLLSGLI